MIALTQLAADPRLLGGVFGNPSYAPMVACLKAAFGEPLTPAEQRDQFSALAGGRAVPPGAAAGWARSPVVGRARPQAAALVVIALALCREWPTAPGAGGRSHCCWLLTASRRRWARSGS